MVDPLPKEICKIICEYAALNAFVIHMKQLNFNHKEASMVVSHPLSIKAKNTFLLKCLSAECSHALYGDAFVFTFGIFSMNRCLYPWEYKKRGSYRNSYVPFNTYKLLTKEEISDGQKRQETYFIDVAAAIHTRTSKPRFQIIHLEKNTVNKIWKLATTKDSEVLANSTSLHLLNDDDTTRVMYHVNNSSNPRDNNGIYLKFNNSTHNPGCYNLSFEVWDSKLQRYYILGDVIEIDVEDSEWYIVFGGPCCNCKNTTGHTYLLQRIE